MECKHKKKYFRPNDLGYETICIDCKKVIRKSNSPFLDFDKYITLMYHLAVANIVLEAISKELRK